MTVAHCRMKKDRRLAAVVTSFACNRLMFGSRSFNVLRFHALLNFGCLFAHPIRYFAWLFLSAARLYCVCVCVCCPLLRGCHGKAGGPYSA